jgi:hypothetical protein
VDDQTGPELLDALERLIASVRQAHHEAFSEESDEALTELCYAYENLPERDPVGLVTRLRSLLRTPEEDAVLRAAVTFAVTRSAWIRTTPEDDDASEIEYEAAKEALAESLRGITDERLAELMKEGSR